MTSPRPLELGHHRGHDLVGALQVVLADVDHGQHRLVGQQEVGTQQAPVVGVEVAAVERRAFGQVLVRPTQGGHLVGQAAVLLGRLAPLVDLGLDRGQVGQGQLGLHDAQVLERVRRSGHVVIGEGAQHEGDGIGLTDVGQELVAEALTRAGSFDQPADVDELHRGRHHLARRAHLGQLIETVVGHLGHAHVGVLGGEGVGRGQRRGTGQGVVQRRLAGIGEPDEPEAFHRFRVLPGQRRGRGGAGRGCSQG